MRAFIFPGQGSQSVGMGKALFDASPVAREVFQEVDDALGQKLFQLMSEGPEDQLTLTENAQPAIMANAVATLRVLEKEGGVTLAAKADYVAGHSLGEYSALCAAGAFDLATTARLLKTRGQAMQAAADAMAEALGASPPAPPRVPGVANVTASPVSDADTIRDLLVQQVTGRVRWRESVGSMEDIGVTHFVEFGGKVLSPMVKRSASGEVETVSVISMDDIEALLKTL